MSPWKCKCELILAPNYKLGPVLHETDDWAETMKEYIVKTPPPDFLGEKESWAFREARKKSKSGVVFGTDFLSKDVKDVKDGQPLMSDEEFAEMIARKKKELGK